MFPPQRIRRYFEPFLGSGAVFFYVNRTHQPSRSYLGDQNQELTNAYLQVRDHPTRLLDRLELHQQRHNEMHYYRTRKEVPADPVDRAARFIYLNKTCFNGLWRVNSKGEFNVPMGRYHRPPVHTPPLIQHASRALRTAHIKSADFVTLLAPARRGDFIYLDPPYLPLTPSSFTKYTKGDFGIQEHRRLAALYRALDRRGCQLVLSNSDHPLMRKFYAGYRIRRVQARRAINCHGDSRGPVTELVVMNY